MDIVAIVNPISGAGMDPAVAGRRVETLHRELRCRGAHADVHVTRGPGDAAALARAARDRGVQLVLVWGGDGTVNEAGGALVGSDTALGLIPAGSGNGLAAALAIPRRPDAAIEAALSGRTRAIDVGFIGGRPFFNVAGVGFDAHVARLFNARARGSRGRWPYVAIGVREGCSYRGRRYALQLDGTAYTLCALLIVFANGREFGMGARIAPAADLQDGLLDAVIVEDRSVPRRFWDSRHLALGTIARAPRITTRPVRSARVESSEPLEFHVDGEPAISQEPLEVSLRPGALRVQR
ncbi:MAG TPA: diacylglycerol kinase family protein [Vicinamibacterales bacterium]|nr:diacylglycerol kinase family protein [Vicinamibacterales bacterium]